MSLVRIGMSESKDYADGYEAIFGKRDRFRPAADVKADDKPADAKAPGPAAEGAPRADAEGR